MTKGELRELVLICIAEKFEEVRSRPEPPARMWWEHEPWVTDQEFGPRYNSVGWFGVLVPNEAGRVRCLRAIYALESEGLVVCRKDEYSGSKLARVTLTEAGWAVVAKLRNAETTVPTGI
jgi:hypothetical protein